VLPPSREILGAAYTVFPDAATAPREKSYKLEGCHVAPLSLERKTPALLLTKSALSVPANADVMSDGREGSCAMGCQNSWSESTRCAKSGVQMTLPDMTKAKQYNSIRVFMVFTWKITLSEGMNVKE
jgi:hypothetical protein